MDAEGHRDIADASLPAGNTLADQEPATTIVDTGHPLEDPIEALRLQRRNIPSQLSDQYPLLAPLAESLRFTSLTVTGNGITYLSVRDGMSERDLWWRALGLETAFTLQTYLSLRDPSLQMEAFRLQHRTLSTVADIVAFLTAECWTRVVPSMMAGDISVSAGSGILLVSLGIHLTVAMASSIAGERVLAEVNTAILDRIQREAERPGVAEQGRVYIP